VRLEGLHKLEKKSNDLIGNRTREFPACSIVPQPSTLPLCPEGTVGIDAGIEQRPVTACRSSPLSQIADQLAGWAHTPGGLLQ
jgi:hypothetical protein